MRKLLGIFIIFLTSFVFPDSVLAVDIVINSAPSTISDGQFEVNVSIIGPNDGTNYLRIDLYQDGLTNYFGETYNGSAWIGSSSGTNYFPVQIQDSSASAILQGRLGNSLSGYQGPGSYKLRVRRYTSSGNSQVSSDNQTPSDIQITYVTPNPSPTQSPTNSPAPTVIPTISPTKSPTPKPTLKPTVKPTPESSPEVLALETSDPTSAPDPTELPNTESKSKFPVIAVAMIVLGILSIGAAFFPFLQNKFKEYNEKHGKTP